eukprot:s2565_g7.t2
MGLLQPCNSIAALCLTPWRETLEREAVSALNTPKAIQVSLENLVDMNGSVLGKDMPTEGCYLLLSVTALAMALSPWLTRYTATLGGHFFEELQDALGTGVSQAVWATPLALLGYVFQASAAFFFNHEVLTFKGHKCSPRGDVCSSVHGLWVAQVKRRVRLAKAKLCKLQDRAQEEEVALEQVQAVIEESFSLPSLLSPKGGKYLWDTPKNQVLPLEESEDPVVPDEQQPCPGPQMVDLMELLAMKVSVLSRCDTPLHYPRKMVTMASEDQRLKVVFEEQGLGSAGLPAKDSAASSSAVSFSVTEFPATSVAEELDGATTVSATVSFDVTPLAQGTLPSHWVDTKDVLAPPEESRDLEDPSARRALKRGSDSLIHSSGKHWQEDDDVASAVSAVSTETEDLPTSPVLLERSVLEDDRPAHVEDCAISLDEPVPTDSPKADERSDLGPSERSMYHTVLLRSDGHAVACGSNTYGQSKIPILPRCMAYIQVSAGGCHTVLLRSDGSAVTSGSNFHGQCEFSPCMQSIPYTQVDAGAAHTVLLRSDGLVSAYGSNRHGQCDIPALDGGFSYTQVAAGYGHTVLLRSDGRAVPCGDRSDGQCDIPPLAEGIIFTQVSAGSFHTVLLQSDGCAVACGSNEHGQCNIPPLENGMSYTQVSGGGNHTVLLQSDGRAVAVGRNEYGQCTIPPLDENMSYVQVYAGGFHTVFLRSDGTAVASGWNHHGQCDIPRIKRPGCVYVADPTRPRGKDLILQVDFTFKDPASVTWICSNLAGVEKLRFEASASDLASEIHSHIACDLNASLQDLQLVLPDGQLLASIYATNPKATVRMVVPQHLAPWWHPPSEPPPPPWLSFLPG